jgi:hypothetical protein
MRPRVAETPYARAVAIVLGEVNCMVNYLRSELKAHRPVTSLLKNIHDAARGLRTEIDLSGDSPWSRQLTAMAVNEMTMRSYTELQNYLESGTKVLLDGLRQAGDADRPFRQSQMDAAIRFCRCVFGADYAGLLGKAAEIAGQTPPVSTANRRGADRRGVRHRAQLPRPCSHCGRIGAVMM